MDIANIVAQAMKEWAVEKGATHYTHVFQPYIISVGAEKHDSFASLPTDGKIDNTFTGKDLLMGEPDSIIIPIRWIETDMWSKRLYSMGCYITCLHKR